MVTSLRMSGSGEPAEGTELEAAARRRAALADRLRAVRAQLTRMPARPPVAASPAGYTPEGDGAKGEAH